MLHSDIWIEPWQRLLTPFPLLWMWWLTSVDLSGSREAVCVKTVFVNSEVPWKSLLLSLSAWFTNLAVRIRCEGRWMFGWVQTPSLSLTHRLRVSVKDFLLIFHLSSSTRRKLEDRGSGSSTNTWGYEAELYFSLISTHKLMQFSMVSSTVH